MNRPAPDLAAARVALRDGRRARRQGDLGTAATCLRRAVARGETLALAWAELGQILLVQGEDDDAEICYERALRLAWPHHKQGNWETAKRIFVAVGRRPPEYLESDRESPDRPSAANAPRARALASLGQILFHVERRVDAAAACFERAAEIDPRCPYAWMGQAEVAFEDAPERAEPLLHRALELTPEDERGRLRWELIRLRAILCDWHCRDQDIAELMVLVEAGEVDIPPFELNHFPIRPELHLRAARRYATQVAQRAQLGRPEWMFEHAIVSRSRLRIGYLSPDFRRHAVGSLIWDLFRYHDREHFEIFAYSLVDRPDDAIRQAVERGSDHFVDLSSLPPPDAARRIHADGIDLLIDLGGYSAHTRSEILALQPAPVQIGWLGYLDTSGAPWLPWIISDPTVLPPHLEVCYSETAIHLPHCFVASSPITLPEVSKRTLYGLPEEVPLFACFNHPTRIGPRVFSAWMRILSRVPGSILWLYGRGIGALCQNLRLEANARGIDPRRLVFAEKLPRDEHLARLRLVDISLDTFGYNGGATTIEALRSGSPVVTLPGETFMARMGSSLCQAAGTPETVAGSIQDYENLAVELAQDTVRRASLRSKLGDELINSRLFDLSRFVCELESAYRTLWERMVERLPA